MTLVELATLIGSHVELGVSAQLRKAKEVT